MLGLEDLEIMPNRSSLLEWSISLAPHQFILCSICSLTEVKVEEIIAASRDTLIQKIPSYWSITSDQYFCFPLLRLLAPDNRAVLIYWIVQLMLLERWPLISLMLDCWILNSLIIIYERNADAQLMFYKDELGILSVDEFFINISHSPSLIYRQWFSARTLVPLHFLQHRYFSFVCLFFVRSLLDIRISRCHTKLTACPIYFGINILHFRINI